MLWVSLRGRKRPQSILKKLFSARHGFAPFESADVCTVWPDENVNTLKKFCQIVFLTFFLNEPTTKVNDIFKECLTMRMELNRSVTGQSIEISLCKARNYRTNLPKRDIERVYCESLERASRGYNPCLCYPAAYLYKAYINPVRDLPIISLIALLESNLTFSAKINNINIERAHNEGKVPVKERVTNQGSCQCCKTENLCLTFSIKAQLQACGDVQPNPGPDLQSKGCRTPRPASVMVTSYNVRGLKEEAKLRHLLNYFNVANKGKNVDFIVGLQETYIDKQGKIPFLWRGNFFITPGVGQSCGCVTLLSSHLNVVASQHLGNRAHVLVCQKNGEDKPSFIIANLYAPNPNTNEKIEFFESLFEIVQGFQETYSCSNAILLGDFNLNLKPSEVKNRLFTAQERRIASIVRDLLNVSEMKDIWEEQHSFTWRRPNTDCFSTIDRIVFSPRALKLVSASPNWSLSFSDHAAVEASFEWNGVPAPRRIKIPRLDPSLAKTNETRMSLENGFREMISTMPMEWDPHMKLEFAKMAIRTVAERVQAERKRKEKVEEESVNEELDNAIIQLGKGVTRGGHAELLDYIETLRTRKSILIEEKGKRLAERTGTKWYNEGEKSTRYFMRLLNRPMPDDFKVITNSNGDKITSEQGIEEEIVDFYKNLYETYDESIVTQDDNEFFNNLPTISGAGEASICERITVDELRTTLQTCKDSAPGPDGIPYSIIGLLWPTFGPILCNAWNYSLQMGKLPPSHKLSYLKLIPKAGKDLSKIGNWRPISLSNCDHKIITKTYSKRMCEQFKTVIAGRQTAYLKNRLINDNVRAMLSTLKLVESEDSEGLIVSLDAKKAFDSVSHEYIEKCLEKFGCGNFIPVFRTLYADLETNIIFNGKIVKGFKVKRGVKQGDALSCIIFIICMEPLLNNIDRNPMILPISSVALNNPLPKTYAYADDVNATIKNDELSLQALFCEYERLTKQSGLELNADKTEVMLIGRSPNERSYDINYRNKLYQIVTKQEIKINGILFQRNQNDMRTRNVDAVVDRMNQHFKSWGRRGLSILGKILICKTFGISQLIYLLQTMKLTENDFKRINATLYKFIWNRNYLAAKAPERIKREIVNKSIKMCGLGMLNVFELDDSLKIKSLGRLITSNNPFMCLIRERLDLSNFFNPCLNFAYDSQLERAIELLKKDREKLWLDPRMSANKELIAAVRNTSFKQVLSPQGRLSLIAFDLWQRGIRKIGELTLQQLNSLIRFVQNEKRSLLRLAVVTNLNNHIAPVPNPGIIYPINGKFKSLAETSSKEIRENRNMKEPIVDFKIGLNLERSHSLSWGLRISKLTSTRHKNILLKVAHGDIYTNDKLTRYGLKANDQCPRCHQIEDLKHKFINCHYVNLIWTQLARLFKLNQPYDLTKIAMGAMIDYDLGKLTLTAEILQRVHLLKEDQNYLLRPKALILQSLKSVISKERNNGIKRSLKDLLGD